MEYTFHVYNKLAADGATIAIEKLLKNDLMKKLTPAKFLTKTEGAGMRSRTENANFKKNFDGNRDKPPVIVCVGSDLAIGDSLGPIVGSMLRYKTQGLGIYVYGCLETPVTAKEIKYMRNFLRDTHAGSQIIAVDAAVGADGDIGLIKLTDAPLYPGAGANKKLGSIGDISVLGIVAEKSLSNYGLLNTTRLNLVYTMAETVSDALAALLWNKSNAAANG